jgi:hypothetical protein
LLVGQAPSATAQRLAGNGVPRPFFGDGPSVRLLASLLSIEVEDLMCVFELRNLLPKHPGCCKKGDKFDSVQGKLAAHRLMGECAGRRMVLAGRHVAKAFGMSSTPPLSVVVMPRGCLALLLPHPSGVNLWWNSAENRRHAGQVLRRFVKET